MYHKTHNKISLPRINKGIFDNGAYSGTYPPKEGELEDSSRHNQASVSQARVICELSCRAELAQLRSHR